MGGPTTQIRVPVVDAGLGHRSGVSGTGLAKIVLHASPDNWMPDMRERVARRSARSGYAVPDGRVSAQRRRVTHEGTPDARAVRRVWSGPAPLLLRANGALRSKG